MKCIRYIYEVRRGDQISVEIIKQSHRGENFGCRRDGTAIFVYRDDDGSDGVKAFLESSSHPQNDYRSTKTFYLRGSDGTRDNMKIVMTPEEFKIFGEAVNAYNEENGYEGDACDMTRTVTEIMKPDWIILIGGEFETHVPHRTREEIKDFIEESMKEWDLSDGVEVMAFPIQRKPEGAITCRQAGLVWSE